MTEQAPLPANRAARRAAGRNARRLAALGSGAVLATGAAGAMGALVATAPSAGAATITVANTDNTGAGSLRQALLDAAPGDTIDLSGVSGTIQLSGGALDVPVAVTIAGPGASVLTIRGDGADRVIRAYDDFGGGTLTISGVTITNGGADNDRGGSGVYFNCDGGSGNLVVDHVVVTGNTDDRLGAGLYFDACDGGGSLTVSNSVISGNSTTSGGGGIWFDEGDDFTIVNSTIANNSANYYSGGGVIAAAGSQFTMINSTISGNTAGTRGGGVAIINFDNSLIANSTIAGNSTTGTEDFGPGHGGGVTLYTGNLSIVQSTISGNTAAVADGLYFYGALPAPASNRADSRAQALGAQQARGPKAQENGPAIATVTGTIIAGNGDGTDDINGPVDNTNSFTAVSSVLGTVSNVPFTDGGGNQLGVTNPGLAPLANNGGSTETMALVAGSVAIDAGPATVPAFEGNEFDQRGAGFARVVNGKVDVGAFEVQAAAPIDLAPRFTG